MMDEKDLVKTVRIGVMAVWTILLLMLFAWLIILNPSLFQTQNEKQELPNQLESRWAPPDSTLINTLPDSELILYGRELIAHTAVYLGPKGSVAQISNGMNCQNCHLKGGKQFFSNNFSAVASTYPKQRARSGTVETIERRVNDCMERSLNGTPIENEGREMKSMVAYIKWVGREVPKEMTPAGAGVVQLEHLDHAANPQKGKIVFKNNCVRCHGEEGLGQLNENGLEWKYPPLHGVNSFNIGAGIFRISAMAGFVKVNMPNDVVTYDKPLLTDEEAWDVAAYLVSLPRPVKDFPNDWPDVKQKPIDHPFGPYADSYSEQEHKYGPFDKMVKNK